MVEKKVELAPGKTLHINKLPYTIKQVAAENSYVQVILEGKDGFYVYMYPEEKGENLFFRLEKDETDQFVPGEPIPIKEVRA